MNYNVILFISAFFTVSYGDEWNPTIPLDFKVIRAECLQENSISEEPIEKIDPLEYPNEQPVRKYTLCAAKKTGLFDENQGYIAERFEELRKSSKTKKEDMDIFNGCIDKNEQKSSAEEWAYRGFICIAQGLFNLSKKRSKI